MFFREHLGRVGRCITIDRQNLPCIYRTSLATRAPLEAHHIRFPPVKLVALAVLVCNPK